jgi:hypothetical protein
MRGWERRSTAGRGRAWLAGCSRRPWRAIGAAVGLLIAGSGASAGTVFRATFDAGPEDFVWVADAFRGTRAPEQVSGLHRPAVDDDPSALEIVLGNPDRGAVRGMSGAWQRTFTTSHPLDHVRIRVRYRMTMASGYEADEFVQLVIRLDGRPVPGEGVDYVHRIAGDGDGGPERTTGWIVVAFDEGRLAAGRHVLRVGAYGNKRTASDESTRILLDEIEVSGFESERSRATPGSDAPGLAQVGVGAFAGPGLR